jgi:hypothetical protein
MEGSSCAEVSAVDKEVLSAAVPHIQKHHGHIQEAVGCRERENVPVIDGRNVKRSSRKNEQAISDLVQPSPELSL